MAGESAVPIQLGLNLNTECEYEIGADIEIGDEASIVEIVETVSANMAAGNGLIKRPLGFDPQKVESSRNFEKKYPPWTHRL